MTSTVRLLQLLLLALPVPTTALSSISSTKAPRHFHLSPVMIDDTQNEKATTTATSSCAAVESAPWRVTLDIGREPLSRMPFDWARSGCRMPLTIGLDFESSNHGQAQQQQQHRQTARPRSETISFTGPNGAVVRPVLGGDWQLSADQKELAFSLTFPETMVRRDVVIEGGTTLHLTGRVYSQTELDQLNQEYYQAREATWEVGRQLNDMANRQGAAKKWNDETKQWVKRYSNENPISAWSKQIQYFAAKAKQDQRNKQRPDNNISDRGPFPGVDQGLYVSRRGGVVRQGKNGPVMGTWYAQPIRNQPVSYRRGS
ncbi:hypothetical protein ACA910_010288 [Epithemia clementina (nom. ined.)]